MYWLHAAQKLAFAKIHRNGSQAGLAAARMHAEAPPGHAGPHRLSDKISPSQPSSVGTEATCPVVVAHILARWRMPMVRPVRPPVCPCTWVVPLVGLGSMVRGLRGRAELGDRRCSL